jgi:Domain of unknown function (DUF5979)
MTYLRALRNLLLGAFVLAIVCDMAHGQTSEVGISKVLCSPPPINPTDLSGCATTLPVPPYASVSYAITLNNLLPSPNSVTITEAYPPDFVFTGVTCTALGTNAQVVPTKTDPSGKSIGVLNLSPSQQVVCQVTGHFTAAAYADTGGTASNKATISNSSGSNSAQINTALASSPQLPTDVSVQKSVSPTSIDVSGGPQTITYTIVITNSSIGAPVDLGPILQLSDQISVPSSSVPLQATYVTGSANCTPSGPACLTATPIFTNSPVTISTGQSTPFLQWQYPSGNPGLLMPGQSITLTYQVQISSVPGVNCVIQPGGDMLGNSAFIGFNAGSTTITDQNSGNNTSLTSYVAVTTGATAVVSNCGVLNGGPPPPGWPPPGLVVVKTQTPPQSSSPMPWGPVTYQVQITNTTSQPIYNITLGDSITDLPGTPTPFSAVVTSFTCSIPCAGAAATAQQLNGYYVSKQVWSGSLAVLNPSQTETINLTVNLSNSSCLSLAASPQTPVENTFVATYNVTAVIKGVSMTMPYNVGSSVSTNMAPMPPCQFIVLKNTVGNSNKIIFKHLFGYTVTYQNADSLHSHTAGTVIDALRIVQPNYATQLPVTYNYFCPSSSGVSGSPPTSGSGLVSVVHTNNPAQGVRIIQNKGPVIFGPGAKLICNVQITVQRPPEGDPYCLSSVLPLLENTGLMDVSQFYNSSLPWPPSPSPYTVPVGPGSQPTGAPTNWATVSTPLPRCFDLVVNKVVSPTITWTTGGPLTYKVTVVNMGDTITGGPGSPWNGPILTDFFQGQYPYTPTLVTAPKDTCHGTPPGICQWISNPGPPLPSTVLIGIQNLVHSGQIEFQFSVTGPYQLNVKPNPGTVTNVAASYLYGTNSNTDWYSNNDTSCNGVPVPSNQGTCTQVQVPVLPVNSMTVTKKIVNQTNGSAATSTASFPFTVSCTLPDNSQKIYGPFSLLDGQSYTVTGIPVTSTCKAIEGTLPGLIPSATCGGNAGWLPPVTYSPAAVVIPMPGTIPNITAQNTLACGSLLVRKVFILDGNTSQLQFLPPSVQLQLTCTSPASSQPITLNAPSYQTTVANLSVGSQCTLTEPSPPTVWNATGQATTIQPGPQTLTVQNSVAGYSMGAGNAQLTVQKEVLTNGSYQPIPVASLTFGLTSTCNTVLNPAGSIFVFAAAGTGYSGLWSEPFPAGTQCGIAETSWPKVFGCHWGATSYFVDRDDGKGFVVYQPPGSMVSLTSAQHTYVIDIQNNLLCP